MIAYLKTSLKNLHFRFIDAAIELQHAEAVLQFLVTGIAECIHWAFQVL